MAGSIPSVKPTGSQGDQYAEEMKGKSDEDLKGIVNDANAPEWYKKMAIEEIANRAGKNAGEKKPKEDEGDIEEPPASGGGGGIDGGEDEEDLGSLWKLLASGKINDQQMAKLAEMLGLKPEDLAAMKGKADPNAVPQESSGTPSA